MYGAIVGDIVGSTFEFANTKRKDFELFHPSSTFTDDSVLTCATADALMSGKGYAAAYQRYANTYPGRGYGRLFSEWATSPNPPPYNSFGNGSAMRVSPIGLWFDSLEETLAEAKRSAEVTHNHVEGIKGAQAVAAAIFLARTGESKEGIKRYVEKTFGYDLDFSLDEIRPSYQFDETCQGSVPQALCAFLESTGFEDAIRNAVSIGGDSDTLAAITGGIAEAFYGGVPWQILFITRGYLDARLDVVMQSFYETLKKR